MPLYNITHFTIRRKENAMNISDSILESEDIANAIGACQESLKKLSITPELLSLNIQKSSLAAAEAQYLLESSEIPSDLALEQARVKKEMVFINCATKCLQKSNATSEVLVSNLRKELEYANEEYWSMKSVMEEKEKITPNYLIMKQDEYVKRAMVLKEKILSSGIPAFGLYKSIMDYSQNVNRSQAQLAKLSDMLKKYGNLPPDIQEAKIKLIKAKAKLEELNQQLQQKIVADI